MNKSTLLKNFAVTETGIEPLRDNLQQEDYLRAALEYLRIIHAAKFKLGDILNQFRDRFGSNSVQSYLIPNVLAQSNYKQATLDNSMSLARHFPSEERSDLLSPSHYHDLQSVQSDRERAKLIRWFLHELQCGNEVKQPEWRERIRIAKLASGQGISRRGNAAKRRNEPMS